MLVYVLDLAVLLLRTHNLWYGPYRIPDRGCAATICSYGILLLVHVLYARSTP